MQLIDDEWATYEEWQDQGLQVAKGEKATRQTWLGTALFHISQVNPKYSDEDVGYFYYDSKCDWQLQTK